MIYGTIVLFFVVLVFWLTIIYVSSCGLTLSCQQALPKVDRTPIPTLVPAGHVQPVMEEVAEFNQCQVNAADLIQAWVASGSPETDPFPFSDVNGNPCKGTYASDVQPLFVENSLWYAGALGCVSCHNADLTERSAGLDMTTYQSILMGSGRADANASGKDILGGGNWEGSALYKVIASQGFAPAGHSADTQAVNLLLYAGQREVEATPTP
jgi:hypothetical protein